LAAAVLAAGLALWQRREEWAFVAGVTLNLAVSLLVCDAYAAEDVQRWWLPLVRANVLAAAGFAMLWLAAARHLFRTSRPALNISPLLACQILLTVLGNLALVIGPAGELIAQPGSPSAAVVHGGEIWAWLALLATLAAALWYVGRALAEFG